MFPLGEPLLEHTASVIGKRETALKSVLHTLFRASRRVMDFCPDFIVDGVRGLYKGCEMVLLGSVCTSEG